MKKYSFFILFMLFTFSVNAQQVSDKYLTGAVTETDGKVVFKRAISPNKSMSDAEIFTMVDKWALENMDTSDELNSRILLSDPQKKTIACAYDKYFVFKDAALVLDRAKMTSQLILEINDGKCIITLRNIKYEYSDSKTPHPAEKLIIDKYALNKQGTKLNRYYDKFRTYTIDEVDNIVNSINVYLNGAPVAVADQPVQVQPAVVAEKAPVVVAAPVETVAAMAGFKKVSAEKIPASLSNKDALIITGTQDKPVVFAASWGGTTTLLDKLMGVSTTQQSTSVINDGQVYTISFYTEIYSDAVGEIKSTKGNVNDKIKNAGLTTISTPSGAPVFSEAWMVIECRKAGVLPSAGTSVTDLGEILNVWIK